MQPNSQLIERKVRLQQRKAEGRGQRLPFGQTMIKAGKWSEDDKDCLSVNNRDTAARTIPTVITGSSPRW